MAWLDIGRTSASRRGSCRSPRKAGPADTRARSRAPAEIRKSWRASRPRWGAR